LDRDVSANLLVNRAVIEFLDRLPTADATLRARARKKQRSRAGGPS
jgi:hypothetical protein